MSEKIKRSESGIESTIAKIKFHSYLKYTSSISSLVHGNSKLASIIITTMREIQILTFLLDEKFSHYWSIRKSNLLHKIKFFFNPGLIYKEKDPNLEKFFEYFILCWISIGLIRCLIKIVFTDSHSKHLKKEQKKLRWDAIEIFISYNLLSFPMCTFFFWKVLNGKFDGITFASIFIVAFYLWKTFLGMSADYDRRILKTGFGCNVFLIHIGVVILFNYFYMKVKALSLSFILLGGFLASFVVKSKSDQYICQSIRSIEVSASAVSLWISIVLTSSIITGYFAKGIGYFVIMSVLLLISTLVLKPFNIKRVLQFPEEKEFLSLGQIELLLHLSKHQKHLSDEDKLLISNTIDSYSFEGAVEELISLRFHRESSTNKRMSNIVMIKTGVGEEATLTRTRKTRTTTGRRTTKSFSRMSTVNRSQKNPEENFRLKKFYEFIYEKYQYNLKKTIEDFTSNLEVKISFAYFLYDFMDLTNESQFQFMSVDLTKELKTDHEIDLQRFKDISVDDIEEKKKKSKILDIKGSKAIKSLHQMLEQANNQYGILWLNLLEGNPSIRKIRDSLLKSQKKITLLKKFWNRNFEMMSSNVGSLTLYGTFLKDVLNEKEQGREIIVKGKQILKKLTIERNKLTNLDRTNDITTVSDPICVIERIDNELYVKSCNHQFSFLLGYQKADLRRRLWKNFIFEKSINFYRKKLSMSSINEEDDSEDIFTMEEDLEYDQLPLLFINKLGFLRIFYADLIATKRRKKPRYIVMRVHTMKYVRPEAFILTDMHLNIVNHNEMFSWFFRLKHLKFMFNEIESLPELAKEFGEMDIFDYYKGADFSLYNPKQKKIDDFYLKILRTVDCSQFLIFNFTRKKDVKTSALVQEIHQKLKLTKLLKNSGINSKYYIPPKENKRKFVFYINEKIEYEGVMATKSTTEENLNSRRLSLLNCYEIEKCQKFNSDFEIKDQFSEGIRTRRLFKGELRDVSEFEVAEFSDEFSDYSFSKEEKTQRHNDFSKTNIFFIPKNNKKVRNKIFQESGIEKKKKKRPKKLKKIRKFTIKESTTNSKIKHLRIFSFLLLVATFAFFSINFLKLKNTVEDLNNYIKINSLCQSRNEKIKFMYQRIFDIAATNQDIYPFHTFKKFYTKENFLQENFDRFLIDAKEMDYYQKVLFELYDKVGAKNELRKETNDDVIKMELQQQIFMRSFVEFFQMAKSVTAEIKSTDVHVLGFQNPDVEFVQKNFIEKISTLSSKLRKFIQARMEDVRAEYVVFKDKFFTVFTIRSILVTVIIIFLSRQILKEKHQRLECFLSFKNKYLKKRWEKIEEFHLIFQLGKYEDYDFLEEKGDDTSDSEKEEFHKSEFTLSGKKLVTGKIHSILSFFNLFILIMMGFNYGSMRVDFDFHDGLTKDLAEMAVTVVQFSRSVNKCHFMYLSMSEMLLHPKPTILKKHPVPYYKIPHLAFIKLYGLSLEAVVEISQTDEIYKEKYLELFAGSRCGDNAPPFVQNEDEEFKVKCGDLYDGVLKHSFFSALSLYETRLQTLFERYSAIVLNKEDKVLMFGGNCQDFPNEKNSMKRSLKCLFTSKLLFEIKLFQTQYFYPTVTKINMEAIKSSERKMEYIDRVSVVLMGAFLLSEISIVLVLLALSCKSETELLRYDEMMKYHTAKDIEENEKMREYLYEFSSR